jgi:hypothetical protein
MVELRSGRSGRVPKPVLGKAAGSARPPDARARIPGGGAALVVRCLRCRHEAVLSAAELAAHGVKADSPIAGFVRRLKCSQCGSGSVLAKRVAMSEPRQRRSA